MLTYNVILRADLLLVNISGIFFFHKLTFIAKNRYSTSTREVYRRIQVHISGNTDYQSLKFHDLMY